MANRSAGAPHPVVAVLGASGGVGASTWAAALAARLTVHDGVSVLVDGHVGSGGVEMTCGIEHVPGLRWPDLAGLSGAADGARLLGALPQGEAAVLSADGSGEPVEPEVIYDVLDALAGAATVVIDLPTWSPLNPQILAAADAVHIVSGLEARQVADGRATLSAVVATGRPANRVGIITRSEQKFGAQMLEIVDQLGGVHIAHVRDDARVRRDAERGEWPGRRGGLRAAADSAALDLVESPTSAALVGGRAA